MNHTKEQHERRAVAYLVNALQRNPLEEGAAIVHRRNRLLGIEAAAPDKQQAHSEIDPRQRRQEVIGRLEEIRAAFWAMPLAELTAELERLDANDFPDLRAAVDRLRLVAAHRADFPALVKHRHFEGNFFSVFKEVLVSSPKEVAIAKERMLAGFSNSRNRKRGKKMIALVKQELPAIYELEASWLESLGRQRTRYKKAEYVTTSSSSGGSSLTNIPWWVFIVVGLIIKALLSASRH